MRTPLIIVSAPSGAGKSSLCCRALKDYPQLVYNVTHTTRPPREGEVDGKHYHFIDEGHFQRLISQDFFVEWANVHGTLYGTARQNLEKAWSARLFLVMAIDVQGMRTLCRLYPDSCTIFVLPPSLEELRLRIHERDMGQTQNLELRLQNAQREIETACEYNHQVVNHNFEEAYEKFRKIIENVLR